MYSWSRLIELQILNSPSSSCLSKTIPSKEGILRLGKFYNSTSSKLEILDQGNSKAEGAQYFMLKEQTPNQMSE